MRLLSIISLILALVLFPPASLALVSNNAVPGDVTYPIKRTLEDGIYAIASLNPITRAWFSAARSDRRFKEFSTLITQGKSASNTLNELVVQTEVAASEIKKINDPIRRQQLLNQLSQSIDKYDQKLEEISQPAPTLAQPSPTPAVTPSPTRTSPPAITPKPTVLPQPTPRPQETPRPSVTPAPTPTSATTPPVDPEEAEEARRKLEEIKKRLAEEAQKSFQEKSEERKEREEKREERRKDREDEQRAKDKEERNKDSNHDKKRD